MARRRRHPGHRRRIEPPRPPPVPLDEELARVLPVLREAVTLGVPVSVDTYKPEVMRQRWTWAPTSSTTSGRCASPARAKPSPAHPDLRRLPDAHARRAADHAAPRRWKATPCRRCWRSCSSERRRCAARASRGAHRAGTPASVSARRWSRISPCWRASASCWRTASRCWPAGRASRRWAPSPGKPVNERMAPSVAAAVLAVERGARIVRVHDVRETVAALEVWQAMTSAQQHSTGDKT